MVRLFCDSKTYWVYRLCDNDSVATFFERENLGNGLLAYIHDGEMECVDYMLRIPVAFSTYVFDGESYTCTDMLGVPPMVQQIARYFKVDSQC